MSEYNAREAMQIWRIRQQNKGLKQVNLWVHRDAEQRLRAYVKRINKKSLAARGERDD